MIALAKVARSIEVAEEKAQGRASLRVGQQIGVGLRQALGLPHPQQGERWIEPDRSDGLLLDDRPMLQIAEQVGRVCGFARIIHVDHAGPAPD
jgi:hypothetical protein